jgi:hypothetical protein
MTKTTRDGIRLTPFVAIGYKQVTAWRFVDMQTGEVIGPDHATEAEVQAEAAKFHDVYTRDEVTEYTPALTRSEVSAVLMLINSLVLPPLNTPALETLFVRLNSVRQKLESDERNSLMLESHVALGCPAFKFVR